MNDLNISISPKVSLFRKSFGFEILKNSFKTIDKQTKRNWFYIIELSKPVFN